ncbi:MAG: DUF6165 family protein [Candidatus Pelagibacterales bacterium]|jgi:hypothetical protein|tara:strand:- start:379 stop:765 length:387 start_codon:yes stop_codon:yes gene_type:complete
MKINLPASIGELFDKITILEIKKLKIKDKTKLKIVNQELTLLKKVVLTKKINRRKLTSTIKKLKNINLQLWNVEDKLRVFEKNKSFKKDFVSYARKVYHMNDKRAFLKNEINIKTNSLISEVKSYEEY